MPFLGDTNVLLRFTNLDDPEHPLVREAVRLLLARPEQLFYTQQSRREFWSVATRPAANNGWGYTIQQTLQALAEVDATFVRLPDRAESGPEWDRLVTQYGVTGRAVHDAHLVASMLAHGVPQILTLNVGDFQRYAAEITVVHPAAVVPVPPQRQ